MFYVILNKLHPLVRIMHGRVTCLMGGEIIISNTATLRNILSFKTKEKVW